MITYKFFKTEIFQDSLKVILTVDNSFSETYSFKIDFDHKLLFGHFTIEWYKSNGAWLTSKDDEKKISVTNDLIRNLVVRISDMVDLSNSNTRIQVVEHWKKMITSHIKDLDLSKVEQSGKTSSEVIIYITEEPSLYEKENIVNACGEFMEALGFEMETEDEPIYNSFWQRIKFIFKKNITEQDFNDLFDKGKKALELKYVELPTAEQTEKLSIAAENILRSVDKYDNCTIRLGSLLIIKRMNGAEPVLKIHQLSLNEIQFLEKNNSIIKSVDPLSVLSSLNEVEEHMTNWDETLITWHSQINENNKIEIEELPSSLDQQVVKEEPLLKNSKEIVSKEGKAEHK